MSSRSGSRSLSERRAAGPATARTGPDLTCEAFADPVDVVTFTTTVARTDLSAGPVVVASGPGAAFQVRLTLQATP